MTAAHRDSYVAIYLTGSKTVDLDCLLVLVIYIIEILYGGIDGIFSNCLRVIISGLSLIIGQTLPLENGGLICAFTLTTSVDGMTYNASSDGE